MDTSDPIKGLDRTLQVQIRYFARLKEAFGQAEEKLALPSDAHTVAAVTAALRDRGGVWASELAPHRAVRVAVNQEMANADSEIKAGDEIAFFPPVTGG